MRAIRVNSFGPPSELQLENIPKPDLQPDEVLVQVHAAAVNPSDVKNVMGSMDITTLPRTPGRDFAGIVIEGAAELIGTEVWGTGGDIGFTRDGSHAECIVLPKQAVRPKPQTLTMEVAGSVGVTYVTAWLCVVDAAQLLAGETVVVIGATGGVGSAALQIAKWKGARIIGTIRRESDQEAVKHLQLDTVVNLTEQNLHEVVLAATDGKGANVIIDTVSGSMVETCLQALAPKGRLTEISTPAKERQCSFDLLNFYRRQLRLLGVNSLELNAIACASILELLTPGFEAKTLNPATNIETYAIEDAVKGYEQVLSRSTSNKVVLTPNRVPSV